MTETLQQRARYRAAWTEDKGAARLMTEMADRLDALEAAQAPAKQPCQTCNGTGRRFPFAEPGCTAHDTPCAACGGSGAKYTGPGEKPHRYSPDIMAQGDCRVCGHTKEAHQ